MKAILLGLALVLVILLIQDVSALRLVDRCSLCETVLRSSYGHLGKEVRSRRRLGKTLESTCKRYPYYKASCLRVMGGNTDFIFDSFQSGKYDPFQTCIKLMECPPPSPPAVEGPAPEGSGVEQNTILE